ncbi:hypothetical protein CU097_006863 [Rhizopus azygosporus]|uniref:Uncharacterized protein n=1 Tax=Rhizopus azygosporus TaxID=86630 RepID=A0A367KE35_RHIAZ|nr:hypothetical protein CU097_006863 [Rhizopus azygosporus]
MTDNEDDYGPVISAWGSQTTNDPTALWHTLADPDAKPGPKGIGSGNLHRRGKNYIPISEEQILAHRLHQGATKKKLTPNEPKIPKKKKENTNCSPKKPLQAAPKPKSLETTPSFTTLRPIKNEESNRWKQLVETPFWEIHENNTNTTSSSSSDRKETNGNSPRSVATTTKELSESNWDKTETNGWDTARATQDLGRWDDRTTDRSTTNIDEQSVTETISTPKDEMTITDKVEQADDWAAAAKQSWGITETNDSNDTTEGWGAPVNNQSTGWGTIAEDNKADDWTTAASTVGASITDWTSQQSTYKIASWDMTPQQSAQDNWGTESKKQWGAAEDDSTNDLMKPTWLASPTEKDDRDANGKLRFSKANKKKYSESKYSDVPKPMNYGRNKEIPIPSDIAPAPPPENTVLVTVNVELSATVSVPVTIKELDEPEKLALEFAEKYNLRSDSVIQALQSLFESQKEIALKSKHKRLQKKKLYQAYPTNSPNCYPFKYPSNNNVHTKHTRFSSRTSFASTTEQVPFARKQYY